MSQIRTYRPMYRRNGQGRKYGNRKVQIDGYTFDSVKEGNRYIELKYLLAAGKIENLEMQKPYELVPAFRNAKTGKMERPMYYRADFVYFDRYDDGDPYDDPTYIRCFRNAVAGLRSGVKLHIGFNGGKGKHHEWVCVPLRMEYSAKDDKFRLVTRSNKGGENSINVARMTDCYLKEPFTEKEKAGTSGGRSSVELMLTDERNALERAMLHFSHFEKETERVERKTYLLRIVYDQEDETELLIRIIGFGPMVRVTGPERFRELIKERLEMQMTCALH